jgi:transposase
VLGKKAAWRHSAGRRTSDGGDRAAIIYSLIETCKLNHIDPQRYLHHVLERIADHPINCIEDLLPWNLVDHQSA